MAHYLLHGLSDAEVAALFVQHGSAQKVADILGLTLSGAQSARARLRKREYDCGTSTIGRPPKPHAPPRSPVDATC